MRSDSDLLNKFLSNISSDLAADIQSRDNSISYAHVERPKIDSVFHKINLNYEAAEPIAISMDDINMDEIENYNGQMVYKNQLILLYRQYQHYNLRHSFIDLNDPYSMPNRYYHLCKCEHLTEVVPEAKIEKDYTFTNRHDGAFPCVVYDHVTRPGERLDRKKIAFLRICPSCFENLRLARKGYTLRNFDLERYYKEETVKLHQMHKGFTEKDQESTRGHEYSVMRKEIADFAKKYYGYRCSECGRQFDHDHLEIHHKDKNPQNNTLENLAVLCKECHDRHHPTRPGANTSKYKNKHR